MRKNSLDKIVEQLKKYKTFALFCHISPDADTIGSCQALKIALTKMGKVADIYCDDNVGEKEKFMFDNIIVGQAVSKEYDMFVALDCGAFRLLGQYASIFQNKKNTIQIDHHAKSQKIGNYCYVNPKSSSCSLIIFDLINKLGIKIDKNMAYYLYCGILGDTAGFRHNNTEPYSFEVAYKLTSLGIDYVDINYRLFKKKNTNYLLYIKEVLKNYKVVDNKFAYSVVRYKQYKKIGKYKNSILIYELLTGGECDIFINITEKEKGKFDISFRSEFNDVGQIARQLGGGGHKCASGAVYYGSLKNLIKQLKAIIK